MEITKFFTSTFQIIAHRLLLINLLSGNHFGLSLSDYFYTYTEKYIFIVKDSLSIKYRSSSQFPDSCFLTACSIDSKSTHLFWGKYDLFSGVNIWALFLSDWVLVNGEYLDLEVFSFGVNMLDWKMTKQTWTYLKYLNSHQNTIKLQVQCAAVDALKWINVKLRRYPWGIQ